MRKISDYRDEDALDLLADIMEPAVEILADETVRKTFESENRMKLASVAIKGHKEAVMQILARLEGVPREEYHCTIFTLPAVVLEVLNDQELLGFFTAQARTMSTAASSGKPTANIKAVEPVAE
jgi:hypothetical protein